MAAKLFDIHAHYTDKKFEAVEGGAEALLGRLFASDVGNIVNVGTNMRDSLEAVALAEKFDGMYAAVGIHPTDSQSVADPDAALGELDALLREHKKHKIVAVGEIGLDYYWEPVDKKRQAEFLEAQLELARKYSLPVEIHDRDAHGDCLDMIRRFPDVRGVFHSFSGSPEMALELVRRGWYISFSGVITFKNARRTPECAAVIPRDRILTETDCPYLAPVPHRGELNHSGLMLNTAEKIGELIGMSTDETIALTSENARAFFGL